MTGHELQLRRAALALTQQQFADALGVSRRTVETWESSRRREHEVQLSGPIKIILDQLEADRPKPAIYTAEELEHIQAVARRDCAAGVTQDRESLARWDFWTFEGEKLARAYRVYFDHLTTLRGSA